ncbi:MAG: helix-turn-helix transcriptional regulator [Treponema sp.]|nr:helix-turn-helix transcriptional regulator [Treponema sp.]
MTTVESIRHAVARNIKNFREEKGFTQEMLAEKLEKSTSHIANIESGKTGISDDLLCKLCNIFGKKPSEIYSDIDIDFEFDKRLNVVVRDTVKAEFANVANEVSEKILRQVTARIVSKKYIERRNERIPLRKVSSPENKK